MSDISAATLDRPTAASAASGERPIDLVHLARMTLGERSLEREVLELFDRQATLLLERMQAAPATRHTFSCSHAEGFGPRHRCRRRRACGRDRGIHGLRSTRPPAGAPWQPSALPPTRRAPTSPSFCVSTDIFSRSVMLRCPREARASKHGSRCKSGVADLRILDRSRVNPRSVPRRPSRAALSRGLVTVTCHQFRPTTGWELPRPDRAVIERPSPVFSPLIEIS